MTHTKRAKVFYALGAVVALAAFCFLGFAIGHTQHITKVVNVPVPGPTVTQTQDVPVPGPTVTQTVPGPVVTVPGPTQTVPGPTITRTQMVPGPTVTVTVPPPPSMGNG
jgi:hypothetical protein